MPANSGKPVDIVTPAGGLFPVATLLVSETTNGMGYIGSGPVLMSPTRHGLNYKDNIAIIGKDATRIATMNLYHQHNLY